MPIDRRYRSVTRLVAVSSSPATAAWLITSFIARVAIDTPASAIATATPAGPPTTATAAASRTPTTALPISSP